MSAPPDPWRAIDELWTEVEAIKARLGPGVGVVRLPATGYALRDLVRDAIVQALEMTDWNQAAAAELLHISHRVMNYQVRIKRITRPAPPIAPNSGPWSPNIPVRVQDGLRNSAHEHAGRAAADDGEPAADGVG